MLHCVSEQWYSRNNIDITMDQHRIYALVWGHICRSVKADEASGFDSTYIIIYHYQLDKSYQLYSNCIVNLGHDSYESLIW